MHHYQNAEFRLFRSSLRVVINDGQDCSQTGPYITGQPGHNYINTRLFELQQSDRRTAAALLSQLTVPGHDTALEMMLNLLPLEENFINQS